MRALSARKRGRKRPFSKTSSPKTPRPPPQRRRPRDGERQWPGGKQVRTELRSSQLRSESTREPQTPLGQHLRQGRHSRTEPWLVFSANPHASFQTLPAEQSGLWAGVHRIPTHPGATCTCSAGPDSSSPFLPETVYPPGKQTLGVHSVQSSVGWGLGMTAAGRLLQSGPPCTLDQAPQASRVKVQQETNQCTPRPRESPRGGIPSKSET